MKTCKICGDEVFYNGFKYIHGRTVAGIPGIESVNYNHGAVYIDKSKKEQSDSEYKRRAYIVIWSIINLYFECELDNWCPQCGGKVDFLTQYCTVCGYGKVRSNE